MPYSLKNTRAILPPINPQKPPQQIPPHQKPTRPPAAELRQLPSLLKIIHHTHKHQIQLFQNSERKLIKQSLAFLGGR
jgi:hypothetical protein